jgi:hypothetical protein
MEYFEYENTSKEEVKLKLAADSIYSAPVFKETTNKKWVNYVDNDKMQYPDRLIYYKNNCALHGAIIRSIVRQYIGNGFTYDTSSNKARLTTQFLDEIDSAELLPKIASDLKDFGGITLAIVWSKDYKKIINIEHIDFSKLRAAIVDPSSGEVPGYFYSWNWNTQRPSNVVFIPSFSEQTAKENAKRYEELKKQLDLDNDNLSSIEQFFKEPTTQILYWKPYAAGSFYYPYPDYVSGTNAIRTSILTDQYGVNSMENGLAIDFVVNFIGQFDDAGKKKEAQAFLKQFTNPAKKKYPLITFSQSKEQQMTIENISGINEDRNYTKINENAIQSILCAHGVPSPLLVGIKTAGQLGGTTELEESKKIFYENVIRPGQLQILKIMNKIMKINDLEILDIEKLSTYTSSQPNNEITTPENKTIK